MDFTITMQETPLECRKEELHDGQLLRAFLDDGAQWAFSELRERHAGLVYSTARRELGDSDRAEDVAQAVFLLLARRAGALRAGALRGSRSLAGWLFQAARLASRNVLRQEQRRQRHEEAAHEMSQSQQAARQGEREMWDSIEPHLHEALSTLSAREREAVLLRIVEGRAAQEVAQRLGVSPNAAQMRVARGVEKMRRFLHKRGVPVTSAVLAALVTSRAAPAAPTGLSAAASASQAKIMQGALHTMKMNAWKGLALKLGVAAVIVGGAGGALTLKHNADAAQAGPLDPGPPPGVADPNSPAVGSWKKGAFSYDLRPDGTGQENFGSRHINPLRWREQSDVITLDVTASEPPVIRLWWSGHLSPDKRSLIITEVRGNYGFHKPVDTVLQKQ